MLVDDHDQMCGGLENTVTVRLSPEEIQQALKGEIIKGQNAKGNKLSVIILIEKNPQPTSAS